MRTAMCSTWDGVGFMLKAMTVIWDAIASQNIHIDKNGAAAPAHTHTGAATAAAAFCITLALNASTQSRMPDKGGKKRLTRYD